MKLVEQLKTPVLTASLYELDPDADGMDRTKYYATSEIDLAVQGDTTTIYQASFVDFDESLQRTLANACKGHFESLAEITANAITKAHEEVKYMMDTTMAVDPMDAYEDRMDTLEHHGTWVDNGEG